MKSKWTHSLAGLVAYSMLLAFLSGVPAAADAREFSATLRFANPFPPKSFPAREHQWWANELEKRTDGRVKVKMFWMESLVKWEDMLAGLSTGVADISVPNPTYHPNEVPLYTVVDMLLNAEDYWAGMMATIDTATNEPGLKAEFERNGIEYIGPWSGGGFYIMTRKPFQSITELRGKTFRSYGGAWVAFLQNLSMNPISMSYGDVYEALERGTIYGNANGVLHLSDALKHYEVIKQATKFNAGLVFGGSSIMINQKVWNGLPKDIQTIILGLRTDMARHFAEALWKMESEVTAKWTTQYGVAFAELSPDDRALVRVAAEKANASYLTALEAKGIPANKTWDYFRRSVKKYEDQVKTEGYPWKRK